MTRLVLALFAVAALTACPKNESDDPFRQGDANEAAVQTAAESSAMALTADSIEVTTDFTLGEGVQKALEDLRDFFVSQVPCATVSLAEGTLTVDYGATGDCEWRGNVYKGAHKISIAKAEADGIEVSHEWVELTNGKATVNGTASVTWSLADKTRRVAHDLEWTVGQFSGSGTGDRTQKATGDGGLEINGERSWTGAAGTWILEIEGVTAYPSDPVPESGTYRLITPKDHEVTLTFLRLDESRIEVTLGVGEREFKVVVRKGAPPDQIEDAQAADGSEATDADAVSG